MSRELPEKPNLAYLKKQAKELLRSTQQGKLADAQHALAQDYGFASWAKLKVHVESLGLSASGIVEGRGVRQRRGAGAHDPEESIRN